MPNISSKLKRSSRTATRKATAKSVRQRTVKSKHLNRQRKKVIPFVSCASGSTYRGRWAPTTFEVTRRAIQNAYHKRQVEELGDKGAKWFVCNQVVNATVEDGDMTQPFRNGYFYTFSGAYTFDIVYVNSANNHVYVIEAKGTQRGATAALSTRLSGKTQGTFPYLDEVVQDMLRSGDPRKVEAANKIQFAPAGKLHYLGVQTTYDRGAGGKITLADQPRAIFNIVR